MTVTALLVRDQNPDPLAWASRLLDRMVTGECASDIASILVDIARDHTRGSVRAALGLEGTRAAIAGARYIPILVLGENPSGRLQALAHRADVDVAVLIEREVCREKVPSLRVDMSITGMCGAIFFSLTIQLSVGAD